jgi:hypothetical protein
MRTNSHQATGDCAADNSEMEMLIDHPIVWKNVATLSLIILALVSIMHFVGNNMGSSREISTLLVSLFEAHAILASMITQWSLDPQSTELLKLIVVILLGTTLSKSYLVFAGKNLESKGLFISIMLGVLLLSLSTGFAWISLQS